MNLALFVLAFISPYGVSPRTDAAVCRIRAGLTSSLFGANPARTYESEHFAAASLTVLTAFPQDRPPLEQDIDRAIDQLYSERSIESHAGATELAAIGRRAVPRLLEELKRSQGRIPNARVRRLICETLGRIRDNSPDVIRALTERLRDSEEFGLSVAAAAAGALAQIADERAAPALIEALKAKDIDQDRWLKYYLIYGLGILRAREAGDLLIKALDDKAFAEIGSTREHHIAAAAADALGRIRAREAADALGKLLASAEINPSTQQTLGVHAARALERVLGESKGSLEGDPATINASLQNWRNWWNSRESEKNVAKTKTQIAETAAALERYKTDQGEYPAILEYLKVKPEGKPLKTWPDGGYYAGDFKDPWGHPLLYNPRAENGSAFDLISFGRDGRPWGDDDAADIWNHENYKPIKIEKTRTALAKIVDALEKFKSDQGRPPDGLQDLMKRPPYVDEKKWPQKGYLDTVPLDGFDQPFQYRNPGTEGAPVDVISWGADGKEGGSNINQDIWNHDRWKAPRVERTRKQLEEVAQAIEKFRKDQGRLPEKLEDLKSKPPYATRWEGAYLIQDLKDAFGNPIVFQASSDGKTFTLTSRGADGKEGGEGPDADIPYPKR